MAPNGYGSRVVAAEEARDRRSEQLKADMNNLRQANAGQLLARINIIEKAWLARIADWCDTETDLLHIIKNLERSHAQTHHVTQTISEQSGQAAIGNRDASPSGPSRSSRNRHEMPKSSAKPSIGLTDHPLVIKIAGDRWVELRCNVCPGKGVNAHWDKETNGVVHFKGIKGLMAHMGNIHKDLGPPWNKDLVLRMCIHRDLRREEIQGLQRWGEKGYPVDKLLLGQEVSPSKASTTTPSALSTPQKRSRPSASGTSKMGHSARASTVSEDSLYEPRSKKIRLSGLMD